MIQLRFIDVSNAADVLRSFRQCAVIAGSGVSLWAPTSLPSGQQFSKGVVDVISSLTRHAPNPPSETEVKGLLSLVPFEGLNEAFPDPERLKLLIADLYRSRSANPIHYALAELSRSGFVHSLVTTNYDSCLDAAFTTLRVPLARVVRNTDVPKSTGRTYFKIHGSADSGEEDTVIHALRFEGTLEPWKRRLFRECLRERPLLLIGYSGFDFDICPEIAGAQPQRVIWNFFRREDADISPGLQRILRAGLSVTVVIGDMSALLRHQTPVGATQPGRSQVVVSDVFLRSFPSEDLALWTARLANQMGYARLAQSVINIARGSTYGFHAELEVGHLYFQLGKYKTSAQLYTRLAQTTQDPILKARAYLHASDATRCYGSLGVAKAIALRATTHFPAGAVPAALRAQQLLKLTLVERSISWPAQRLGLRAIAERARQRAEAFIREGGPLAHKEGLLHDFQQFGWWAERLNMDTTILQHPDGYEPPPSKDGWKHQGYVLAQASVVRDRATGYSAGRRGVVTKRELESALDDVLKLGAHPEIWKIAHAITRNWPKGSRQHLALFVKHFAMCEYNLPMRAVSIAFGN